MVRDKQAWRSEARVTPAPRLVARCLPQRRSLTYSLMLLGPLGSLDGLTSYTRNVNSRR
jgi:hypothetical protein